MENLVAFFAKFSLKREDKLEQKAIGVEATEEEPRKPPALGDGS